MKKPRKQTVQFCCLGQPQVVVGQQVQPLAHERSLWLLAYLAAQEGWVSRDELARVMWPDADLPVGRTRLRQLILRVKDQGLAPQLEVEPQRVRWSSGSDLHVFREALHTKAWTTAHHTFRGMLLEGCSTQASDEFTAWLDLERFKLQSQWRMAAHQHALQLETTDALQAGEVLSTILDHDPLAEDVLCDFLRISCRNGHFDVAIERYRRFSHELEVHLQMQPRPQTQQLVQDLRAQRQGQRQDQEGRPIKVLHPEPVLASREALAPVHGSLVGRQQDLQALLSQLQDPTVQVLTLTGVGGSGKTRLAQEVARHAPLPSLFLGLVGHPAGQPIVQRVAHALGLAASSEQQLEEQLHRVLRETPMLLVLDNVEHILSLARNFVVWLHDLPAVKVLFTSRICLGMMGEHVHGLGGLDWTGEQGGPAPAMQLLLEAASRVQPQTHWTEEGWEAAHQICQRVQGLPLGLELAGAWRRLLEWTEIRDELIRSLDFLTGALPGVPERHSGIGVVFEHSWRLLPENLQRALRRLMVFRGSFERVSALQITGTSNRELLSLVDHSLVRRVRGSDQRFEVHELIREYVMEKVQHHEPEAQEVRDRHAHFFVAYLQQHDPYAPGADQQQALQCLTMEYGNLQLALQTLYEKSDARTLLSLLTPLCLLWVTRNMTVQAFDWLEKILGMQGVQDHSEAYAQLLLNYGNLARFLGQFDLAEKHYLQSLHQSSMFLLGHTACAVRNSLGAMYLIADRVQEAEACFEDNLQALSEMQSPCKHQLSFSHLGKGHVFRMRGDFEKAATCLQTSLHLIQAQGGHHHFQAYVYEGLGILAMDQDHVQDAYRWLLLCIAEKNRLDNKFELADSYHDLGTVALKMGQTGLALEHFVQSLNLAVTWNQWQTVPATVEHLAALCARSGQVEVALTLWGAARALKIRIQLPSARTVPVRSEDLYRHCQGLLGTMEARACEIRGASLTLQQILGVLSDLPTVQSVENRPPAKPPGILPGFASGLSTG